MEEKIKVWQQEYEELNERIRGVFRSKCGRENARKYISGLLSHAGRKNGWQLSEAVGAKTPYALQQFVYRGNWRADDLRDELRGYVTESLGEKDGVLVVDET